MPQEYTPEPWRVAPICDYGDASINIDAGKRGYICKAGVRGDAVAEANGLRIVACVNACAGLLDPEKDIAEMKARIAEAIDDEKRDSEREAAIVQQRNDLLKALKQAVSMLEGLNMDDGGNPDMDELRAVIAKMGG